MQVLRFAGLLVVCAALGCGGGAPSLEEVAEPEGPQGLANGSFSAELNGFEIHYEVHGRGPVLMTVPNSWGLSLEGLRSMYRPLESGVTMVYFDPRGMGESGPVREDSDMGMKAVRDDFDALRQHLGLDRVNAIGWSNGAMNLILLASEKPAILDSAIFVHGTAAFNQEDMQEFAQKYPELMKNWSAMQQELASDDLTVPQKTERMKAFWLAEYFPVATAKPEVTTPVLHEVFSNAEFSWLHAEYANQESPTFDARDRLPAISTRCLVLAGDHDMIPAEKVREFAQALPDGRYVLFADSGHFAPVEQATAFQQSILEFLGVIEPPPSMIPEGDDDQVQQPQQGG